MGKIKPAMMLSTMGLLFFSVNPAGAGPSTIGVLAIDNFLMGDVTIPVEVLGRAIKKEPLAAWEVMVISGGKNREVAADEGLKIVADKTIYDDIQLDVLIVPGAYEIDSFRENQDLIGFIKKQARSVSWIASN